VWFLIAPFCGYDTGCPAKPYLLLSLSLFCSVSSCIKSNQMYTFSHKPLAPKFMLALFVYLFPISQFPNSSFCFRRSTPQHVIGPVFFPRPKTNSWKIRWASGSKASRNFHRASARCRNQHECSFALLDVEYLRVGWWPIPLLSWAAH